MTAVLYGYKNGKNMVKTKSPFFARQGSLALKSWLTFLLFFFILTTALSVYATDADSDGFDDTTPTATFPRDCDDDTAGTRPLMNNSDNFINGSISVLKICSGASYVYENSLIIINSSSNAALTIGCNGNNTGNTTGHGANFTINATGSEVSGNASLRNWIHINGTTSVVTIENCTLIGIGDKNQTAAETNQTIAVNITNSSNVVINNFQVRDTNFGGVHIAGDSNNITIRNSEFSNITGGTADTNLHDVIWAKNGNNINLSFINISITGASFNASSSMGVNLSTNRVVLYSNRFSTNAPLPYVKSNGSSHIINNNSFANATYSLYLDNSDNNTIRENNFTNGKGQNSTGIHFTLSDNNTLSDNFFPNMTGIPVTLHQSRSNLFTGDRFINTSIGIRINTSSHNQFRNITILNMSDAAGGATTAITGAIIIGNNSNNNTILNSSIVFNGTLTAGAGIFVINSSATNITRNDINNFGGSHGIVLVDSENSTLSTNTIRNTSIGLNLTGLSGGNANRQANQIINITIYNATTHAINDTTGATTNNSITFNTSNGSIMWRNLTDMTVFTSNFHLGSNLSIRYNFTSANMTTMYTKLNTTALIIFIDTSSSFPVRAVAYKNSTRCEVGTCTSLGISGTVYEFNLTDWTSASTQGEINLSIGNAVDADADGFTTTGANDTFPADCDDSSANIRPVKNLSETLVGYTLKLCPGTYHNATLVVNASSNNSVIVDCSGQSAANGNFSLGGTARREWLLVNNTNAGSNIVNCTVMGMFYGNGTAQDPKDQATTTVGINITNSSNVNVSAVVLKHLIYPGLVVGGLTDGGNGTAANITILNNSFDNITGDMLWARIGTNINITGNNFTISRDNQSMAININLTTSRALMYNNRFSSAAQAQLRTNESSHSILNNSFGDGNATTAEIAIHNGDNHTFLDNNFSISTAAGSRALYLEGSGNNTIKSNRVMNITSGIGLELNSSSSNTISNNLFANSSINVLINTSSNDVNFSNNDVIFAVSAPGYGLVVNVSDNLTLQNNTYRNNSVGGVVFYNATNITALGEHVRNASVYGFLFNHTSNSRLQNISADGNNNTLNTFAIDTSVNLTLNGFNSTNANGVGLFLINASRINISNFNIINASANGIKILNSTNISSDYDNVTISNINGTSLALINISWNSSFVNLSTLWLAGQGWPGLSPSGFGIYVNQSSFISFHNITVKNTSNTSIIYSNVTGASVIGYCNVTNSSTSVFNIVSDNAALSTSSCTMIVNANMSGATLAVSSDTGTGVAFNVGVNFTGNLNSYVNVSVADLVYVNSTALGGGNLPANITMKGFGYNADGVVVDYEDDGTFHACGSNCTLTSTGTSLSFNVSHFSTYQASARVGGAQGASGAGGSGGGRGGGYKTVVPTINGVSVSLTNYDVARIQYGTGAYQFVLKSSGKDEVAVRIAQQDYNMMAGRALSLDLDKDGTSDVSISLVSVTHNLATFVVKLGASAPVAVAPVVAQETAPSESSAPSVEQTGAAVEETAAAYEEAPVAQEPEAYAPAKKKLGAGMVLTLSVVVIAVLLLVMHFRKKKQPF